MVMVPEMVLCFPGVQSSASATFDKDLKDNHLQVKFFHVEISTLVEIATGENSPQNLCVGRLKHFALFN